LRIATYWWGGRRRVGRLSAGGEDVVPLALGERGRGAPGDIIATGTPSGAGIGFNPPKYLKRGDRVRIEIDGIGVLEHPVH
jgi:hypothetical protein